MEQTLIMDKIKTKRWFCSSKNEIQTNLTNCIDNGFLNTISKIDDENSFGAVIKIIDYWRNNKISGVTFEIRNNLTNQIVQSDFICWNEGNNPLCRGIILIEDQEKVTKIILERKYNLTTFEKEPRSFSMSFPEYISGQVIKLPKNIANSIGNFTILKYIDLGEIHAEDSLLNGNTSLFALIIRTSNINESDLSKVSIINIENNENIINIKDGYLHSIILKLKYQQII